MNKENKKADALAGKVCKLYSDQIRVLKERIFTSSGFKPEGTLISSSAVSHHMEEEEEREEDQLSN